MNPQLQKALKKLPNSPGVYIFRDPIGVVLYVGKAASLKSRVRSYFPLDAARGIKKGDARIEQMVAQISKIETKPTRSALEALFLEAELIKKHQAKYNVMAKDDKTFAYIAITREPIPRIIVVRPTDRRKEKINKLFGPYQSAAIARTALKILRRIFPFHTLKTKPGEKCFHASIGMCSGICGYDGKLEIRNWKFREYRRTVKNIEMFLKGKRTRLEAGLRLQMKAASAQQRYEEAARLRDSLGALRHINDVALLKDEYAEAKLPDSAEAKLLARSLASGSTCIASGSGLHLGVPHRIEAYDISHTFGHEPVGSMVVFTNGKVDPGEFRKFRIRGMFKVAKAKPRPSDRGSSSTSLGEYGRWIDDTAMLREVLTRRLRHREWPMPDLLLMDGGTAQLHAAHAVLKKLRLSIPAAALAKGPARKRADLSTTDSSVKLIPITLLVKLREQAHRFAIRYHRTLRARRFLG